MSANKTTKLTEAQVRHIAKLAKLSLREEEVSKFQDQLSSTIGYVKKLEEVNTSNIDTPAQLTGLKNIFRDDETTPSLSQEETLKNAKATYKGYFKIKAIFEE